MDADEIDEALESEDSFDLFFRSGGGVIPPPPLSDIASFVGAAAVVFVTTALFVEVAKTVARMDAFIDLLGLDGSGDLGGANVTEGRFVSGGMTVGGFIEASTLRGGSTCDSRGLI